VRPFFAFVTPVVNRRSRRPGKLTNYQEAANAYQGMSKQRYHSLRNSLNTQTNTRPFDRSTGEYCRQRTTELQIALKPVT
jgi:hypothetical protein